MRERCVDCVIIGGGPAGLSAAITLKKEGVSDILLLERDVALGGILQQCIHDGFGLHRWGKRLSGGQYAQRLIDELDDGSVEIQLNTTVIEMTADKVLYTISAAHGMQRIQARTIILAMGCRERTRNQVFVAGSRPAGVMTAGAVQRYINLEGYLPGRRAVILGSGDIGLIMARRMTLEGIEVEGVYELKPTLGGLTRNRVQCLEDYDIPLHLSTTVARVHGRRRLEGVTVVEVDDAGVPQPGTERYIPCDLLVLSVGLIPENELSRQAHIDIDPITQGPILDESYMTSVPGVFAAGNVCAVFDLVDYVSETAEVAGRGAAAYLRRLSQGGSVGEVGFKGCSPVAAGADVAFVIPQYVRPEAERLVPDDEKGLSLFMRVKRPMKAATLVVQSDGEQVFRQRRRFLAPPEMVQGYVPLSACHGGTYRVSWEEVEA